MSISISRSTIIPQPASGEVRLTHNTIFLGYHRTHGWFLGAVDDSRGPRSLPIFYQLWNPNIVLETWFNAPQDWDAVDWWPERTAIGLNYFVLGELTFGY